MSLLSGIHRRWAKVREATRLSHRLRDWPGLAVMGLAWANDFSNADPLSKLGRTFFPVVKVRTDRMKHLAVLMNPADASHFVIFNEVTVENVYDLTLVPFVPDLILDCGGHIGLFTARAAAEYPGVKIVTFEPMPKNAAFVEAMVRANGLAVDVRQAAVSDRNSTTRFFERMSYGGSLSADGEGVVNSYDVQLIDLIAFVREQSPSRLLLKMDIEGEEEQLLPKLIPALPRQTALFFETHTAGVAWDALSAELVAAGFEVQLLRNRDPYRDGFALRRESGSASIAPATT